jgi:hypothetical protein
MTMAGPQKDQPTPEQPIPETTTPEEQEAARLKAEIEARLLKQPPAQPQPPQLPGAPDSSSGKKAAEAARRKLAQQRAQRARTRKAQREPQRPPKEPPEPIPSPEEKRDQFLKQLLEQFHLEGIGNLYAAGIEWLACTRLHRQKFDPVKKARLVEFVDDWANVRAASAPDWIIELLPEFVLVGATVKILLETPHAPASHHVDSRNPDQREDHTREGDDGQGELPDSLRSSEPRVHTRADL